MTESTVMQTPGHLLSAAREARSLTQQEVAKRMRLPTQTVIDIDRDAFVELGALTYVRGYLMAYARIVGISNEQILTALDQSGAMLAMPVSRPAIVEGAPVRNVTRQRGRFRFQSKHFTGMGVAVMVVAASIALWPSKKINTAAVPVVTHSVKKHSSFAELSLPKDTSNNDADANLSNAANAAVPTDNTLQDVTIVNNAAPTIHAQPQHTAKHITAHNRFTQPVSGLHPTYTLSPVTNDTETQNS